MRVETGPHSTRLEFKGELEDPCLVDSSDVFLHYEEEGALSVGAMNHVPLERAPFVRGIPRLSATGIIDLVRDPAERAIVRSRSFLPMMGVHESVKASLFDEVHPGRRDPCALLVGYREFAVGSCSRAVGPAEPRCDHADISPISGNFQQSARVLIIRSVALDVVKVPIRVRFQSGGIFVDMFPDTASVVEAFVEVSLAVPI